MNNDVAVDPRVMSVGKFTLTPMGVDVDGLPTLKEWRVAMQFVNRCTAASMWWHGDMLAFGYTTYGDMASQEDDQECGQYKYATLKQYKYVCENVPLSVRTDKLSFSHHQQVAAMEPADQKKWLAKTLEMGWNVAQLKEAVRASVQTDTDISPTASPGPSLSEPEPAGSTSSEDGGPGNVGEPVADDEPANVMVAKLFKGLLEHVRQAVKLTDLIHNATGKKYARAHEYVLTGLDTAGQEAIAWRRLCK